MHSNLPGKHMYVPRWVKRCMWMGWQGTDIHTDLMYSYLPGKHMYVHRWVKHYMWMGWQGTDIHADSMHSYLPGTHMYVHRWVKHCMWMWWLDTDIHADLYALIPARETCMYTGGLNAACEWDDWALTSTLTWCIHTCQGHTHVCTQVGFNAVCDWDVRTPTSTLTWESSILAGEWWVGGIHETNSSSLYSPEAMIISFGIQLLFVPCFQLRPACTAELLKHQCYKCIIITSNCRV